ncbi:MAG: RluA family pseudouridine synthase [Ruminococcaceae bacterium]|nr:RluA family pseudouridine synthase [Oscillospiraceae bacterium]
MDFLVDSEFEGRRLLDFFKKRLAMSRALCTSLKKCDGIAVNGKSVTVRCILHKGDTVSLKIEDGYEDCDESLVAADLPLDILYEDEHIMAINKPPYMPTHLSHGHRLDTLANALKAEFDRRRTPFVVRAVNRLDTDTSGIVIVAKNRYAADRFAKTNPDIRYEKIYTAFCLGSAPEKGEIKSYIRRVEESIITRASYESGKDSEFAHTRFETVARYGGISVVRCEPVTGRTHQLRVHLSSIGHPIVGDDMYGGGLQLPRQALHAGELRFFHPFTGEKIEIIAPLPSDMENFLKEIQNV